MKENKRLIYFVLSVIIIIILIAFIFNSGFEKITSNSYGLWGMVILNSLIVIIFAFSFAKPKTKRDWRSFSAFSAFIVALFTEMYGFPLTIYLFSGWLSNKYPQIDLYSHNSGHLLDTLIGWKFDPHFSPFHILSIVLIGLGFLLLANSWIVLYKAQRKHSIASTGPYSYIRHPQYIGFIIIMLGFLLQWPTLLTLAMFSILLIMYIKLARIEERESLKIFGNRYKEYMKKTPAFIPKHLNKGGE